MLLSSPTRRAPKGFTQPWVHGAFVDVLVGWAWLPVALVLHAVRHDVARTQLLMAVVFVVSFAHQPLTLGLVYGDQRQRLAHARFYAWAPLVATALILIGLNVSLTVVAVMAALWNAEHTLMQRYGLMRIYGRKAGDDHGRLEKPMLIAWLVTALAFVGAFVDLPDMIVRLGIDETNSRGVELLDTIGGLTVIVFWCAAVASVALTVRWVAAERGGMNNPASRAKWVYTLGTLGLVAAVMIDPLAGIGGYVAAHAIEYFAIVHRSLRRRSQVGDDSAVGRWAATPWRRTALYAGYFVALAVFIAATYNLWGGRVYSFAILLFGALHIVYDGLVWKLRQPAVAAAIGIGAAATT